MIHRRSNAFISALRNIITDTKGISFPKVIPLLLLSLALRSMLGLRRFIQRVRLIR